MTGTEGRILRFGVLVTGGGTFLIPEVARPQFNGVQVRRAMFLFRRIMTVMKGLILRFGGQVMEGGTFFILEVGQAQPSGGQDLSEMVLDS